MKFLGLSLSHDSSATLISDSGKILYASAQERFSRIKNDKKFPYDVLKDMIFERKFENDNDLSVKVCYSIYEEPNVYSILSKTITEENELVKSEKRDNIRKNKTGDLSVEQIIEEELKALGFNVVEITRLDHHLSHASAALNSCNFSDDVTIFTIDGFGNGLSSCVYLYSKNEINRINENELKNSVGLVYQFVCGALGFKMKRDEWKLLGLEPDGEIKQEVLDYFRNLLKFDNKTKNIVVTFPESYLKEAQKKYDNEIIKQFVEFNALREYIFDSIKLLLEKNSKQDIAYALQQTVEETIIQWVVNNWDKNSDVAVCGGVALNVKCNQRISKVVSANNKKLWVFPASGDDGNSFGCASYLYWKETNKLLTNFDNVFLGYDLSKRKNEIEKFLIENDIKYKKIDSDNELSKFISNVLLENKGVAVCRGKAEFGPRSMANRGFLFRAEKKEYCDIINKAAGRSTFMPFAPIALRESSDILFDDPKEGFKITDFMVITLYWKKDQAKIYKAVAHRVGTKYETINYSARPQLVDEKNQKFMYLIMKNLKDNGVYALIQTSFNTHGVPIANSYKDCIDEFAYLHLPDSYLVIENFVISMNENDSILKKIGKEYIENYSKKTPDWLLYLESAQNKS